MDHSLRGYLLLADITGYSEYLSGSELEHARETLGSLLGVLVDGARPPLTVSKLEGDAVLSYALSEALIVGQTLLEIIEGTYVSFRRAIELMVLNTTCDCRACANIGNLDLKFFVHHGDFAIQEIGGRQELLGSALVLTHRLLKNTITEMTGLRAYTAYTQAALDRLGRELAEDMEVVELDYPDSGEVVVYVQDMHPVWEASRVKTSVDLQGMRVRLTFDLPIDLPPEVVWDYLADPYFRNVFLDADRVEVTDRQRGRVSQGATFQCYHGDRMVPQLILEWRPFDRMVTRDLIAPFGDGLYGLSIFELSQTVTGTALRFSLAGFAGPRLVRLLASLVLKATTRSWQRQVHRFGEVIEADNASKTRSLVSTSQG